MELKVGAALTVIGRWLPLKSTGLTKFRVLLAVYSLSTSVPGLKLATPHCKESGLAMEAVAEKATLTAAP